MGEPLAGQWTIGFVLAGRVPATAGARQHGHRGRVTASRCLNTYALIAEPKSGGGGMGEHTSWQKRSEQRQLRRRRGERAFLFDEGLSGLVAEFDREEWEWALSACGGNTAEAARECGVKDAQPGMKALWGRSAEDARGRYRQWQARRARSR
jgi:hypothetical protein